MKLRNEGNYSESVSRCIYNLQDLVNEAQTGDVIELPSERIKL